MASSSRARKILVVEDEPFLRELVCRALDDAGFVTVPAGTAADAVKLFRLNDPDAALVDIELGAGPNGIMLATRLRRDVPELPLVFLTVRADPRAAGGPQIPPDAHFVQKKGLKDVNDLIAVMDGAMRGARSETTRHDKSDLNPLRSLTTKQIETLRLIGEGLTNEQIASVRGITLRAAEVMVSKTLKLVGIDETAGNRRVLATRKLF